ncbi:hypothetical protein O0544_21610 [Edwardsiella anguillarum]|nr:hypothetical protein [Edwardsiella anguillarum]
MRGWARFIGEYCRDSAGVWHGGASEAVLNPQQAGARLAALQGEWATVGTGWQTYPDLAQDVGLTLRDGQMLLPHAEDMLPLALHAWQAGETVAVEQAQPIYLRNEVTWKKLPGAASRARGTRR